MIAVVAGATGLVGVELLKILVADPEVAEVRLFSRSPVPIESPKIRRTAISDLAELPDLAGDVYFCCLGTTIKDAGTRENFRKVDFDAVLAFGRLAKRHGAKGFLVVTASGASPRSRIFYSRVKGEVEDALRALSLDRLVIFRPGLLIGDRKKRRVAEKIFVEASKLVAGALPVALKKRLMTYAPELASRMASEAKLSRTGVLVVEARDI